ncbi:MAG: pilus assembly protein PilX [Gammaproteobacteria bacterium]|nr:pilus assembly protein PilX [Gammaproteobacteria bacterium]
MTGYQKHQSGVALIIGLIVLLLLTIIMISALKVTALEERMAGNSQNHNVAFQAAESALREAEAYIESGIPAFAPLELSGSPFRTTTEPYCVNGLCSVTDPLQSEVFPYVNGAKLTAATGIAGIVAEPEYIIELIRTDASTDSSRIYATFRITTRAWGEDNSLVLLQSTYRLHALSFTH